jgi:hypothetical protein
MLPVMCLAVTLASISKSRAAEFSVKIAYNTSLVHMFAYVDMDGIDVESELALYS